MKKLVILSVAGLLLGVGAGTAIAFARRPAAPPALELAADSLATDSLAAVQAAAAGHDSAAAPDREPVPLTGAGDAGPGTLHRTSDAAAAPHAAAAQPLAASRTGTPAAGDTSEVERMSQIFGTMKPQEAARVLEKLEDRQVEVLLMGLSDRKAAAILASFPAERAASLTRSILARNAR